MRHIVEQILESKGTPGLVGANLFYVDDRRLQRNLQRVIADPAMTQAAIAGVIADHRVVETLVKTDAVARNVVLELESKLGRKLGRERAQKLFAQYERVRAARMRSASVRPNLYVPQLAHVN